MGMRVRETNYKTCEYDHVGEGGEELAGVRMAPVLRKEGG